MITPQDFGWHPENDVLANTRIINACLAKGGYIKFPQGQTYTVMVTPENPKGCLPYVDNSTIDFRDATIQLDPNGVLLPGQLAQIFYPVKMDTDETYNVHFKVGTIDGSKATYNFSQGLNGGRAGIGMWACVDSSISGGVIRDCHQDGVIIAGVRGQGTTTYSKNILIDQVEIDGVQRNGISAIEFDGLTIIKPVFKNINGDMPKAAIDLEPNSPLSIADNVMIVDPVVRNCGQGILLAFSSPNQGNNVQVVNPDIETTLGSCLYANYGHMNVTGRGKVSAPTTAPYTAVAVQNSGKITGTLQSIHGGLANLSAGGTVSGSEFDLDVTTLSGAKLWSINFVGDNGGKVKNATILDAANHGPNSSYSAISVVKGKFENVTVNNENPNYLFALGMTNNPSVEGHVTLDRCNLGNGRNGQAFYRGGKAATIVDTKIDDIIYNGTGFVAYETVTTSGTATI